MTKARTSTPSRAALATSAVRKDESVLVAALSADADMIEVVVQDKKEAMKVR